MQSNEYKMIQAYKTKKGSHFVFVQVAQSIAKAHVKAIGVNDQGKRGIAADVTRMIGEIADKAPSMLVSAIEAIKIKFGLDELFPTKPSVSTKERQHEKVQLSESPLPVVEPKLSDDSIRESEINRSSIQAK